MQRIYPQVTVVISDGLPTLSPASFGNKALEITALYMITAISSDLVPPQVNSVEGYHSRCLDHGLFIAQPVFDAEESATVAYQLT